MLSGFGHYPDQTIFEWSINDWQTPAQWDNDVSSSSDNSLDQWGNASDTGAAPRFAAAGLKLVHVDTGQGRFETRSFESSSSVAEGSDTMNFSYSGFLRFQQGNQIAGLLSDTFYIMYTQDFGSPSGSLHPGGSPLRPYGVGSFGSPGGSFETPLEINGWPPDEWILLSDVGGGDGSPVVRFEWRVTDATTGSPVNAVEAIFGITFQMMCIHNNEQHLGPIFSQHMWLHAQAPTS